jgi:hypothetical protein
VPIETTSTVSLDQTVKTADVTTTTTTTGAQKSGASQLIQASILALASIAVVSFF